jgi:hypothetical protein
MFHTNGQRAALGLALAVAGLTLPRPAAARPYAYLGAGPTSFSRGNGPYRENGIAFGLTACATFGGSASFLALGHYDRLTTERHPLTVLIGLRVQASKGPSPYLDLGVGPSFDKGESGYGTTVGVGYHGVQSGPGWFTDLHYLATGSPETTGIRMFQLRFGISTP